MANVYATQDLKEKTAKKVRVVMKNVTNTVNVQKEDVSVNQDGEEKIVKIKCVLMDVLVMVFARIGDVFVNKDGRDLIVLSNNVINLA